MCVGMVGARECHRGTATVRHRQLGRAWLPARARLQVHLPAHRVHGNAQGHGKLLGSRLENFRVLCPPPLTPPHACYLTCPGAGRGTAAVAGTGQPGACPPDPGARPDCGSTHKHRRSLLPRFQMTSPPWSPTTGRCLSSRYGAAAVALDAGETGARRWRQRRATRVQPGGVTSRRQRST